MKFIVAAVALAATALAAPSAATEQCKFGAYRCAAGGHGIDICDISGRWVSVGPCPSGSSCHNIGNIPYCTKNKVDRRQDSGWCPTPGQYTCTADNTGINVCDTQNHIQVSKLVIPYILSHVDKRLTSDP